VTDAGRELERDAELTELVRAAHAAGVTQAVLIPAAAVEVDERVRLKCQVPLCANYGRHLLCPPNLPPVAAVREIAGRYRDAILLAVRTPLTGNDADERRAALEAALRLHRAVNAVERAALPHFPLAAGFIGGACRLCEECVGPGGTCRHPFEARPSMEGMGMDVVSICRRAGVPLKFPAKDEVTWVGLVLVT
jgi:predicted metal-binding protein